MSCFSSLDHTWQARRLVSGHKGITEVDQRTLGALSQRRECFEQQSDMCYLFISQLSGIGLDPRAEGSQLAACKVWKLVSLLAFSQSNLFGNCTIIAFSRGTAVWTLVAYARAGMAEKKALHPSLHFKMVWVNRRHAPKRHHMCLTSSKRMLLSSSHKSFHQPGILPCQSMTVTNSLQGNWLPRER